MEQVREQVTATRSDAIEITGVCDICEVARAQVSVLYHTGHRLLLCGHHANVVVPTLNEEDLWAANFTTTTVVDHHPLLGDAARTVRLWHASFMAQS